MIFKKMNKKASEGDLKNTLFALILMSLFGMLILTAVVGIGSDYGMDTSEITGGSLNLSKFNQSIVSVEQNAQSMNERFAKQSIWSALVGIVVDGFFGILIDIFRMMLLPFGLIQDMLVDVLGVPTYVANIFLGIFIFSIIFAIFRTIKIGE